MFLTLLTAWDCPTRIRTLEARMDKQKLRRIMERSERMNLKKKIKNNNKHLFKSRRIQIVENKGVKIVTVAKSIKLCKEHNRSQFLAIKCR